MRTLLSAAIVGLSLAATVVPAAAEWRLIGEREVTDRTDRDVIVVEGHQRFDHIRICVYRNPVHFIDVDVNYYNGGHQDIPVRAQIPAGGCTRDIDLVGDERDIATINLLYEENSRRHAHAHVRVFAD